MALHRAPWIEVPTRRLVFSVCVYLAFVWGWEFYSKNFAAPEQPFVRVGGVWSDRSRGARLHEGFKQISPASGKRFLVLGNSQIATVKGRDTGSGLAFPPMLSSILSANNVEHDLLDLSSGGQQVVESTTIALSVMQRTHIDGMILGIGLFSMLRSELRSELTESISGLGLREIVEEIALVQAGNEARERLINALAGDHQPLRRRQETLQEKSDKMIASVLAENLNLVANRQEMFRELVDLPVRRDPCDLGKTKDWGSESGTNLRHRRLLCGFVSGPGGARCVCIRASCATLDCHLALRQHTGSCTVHGGYSSTGESGRLSHRTHYSCKSSRCQQTPRCE